MTGDIERRIRERAYEIWESEGRPHGRSDDHWKQARAEFSEASAEAQQASAASNDPVSGSAVKPGRTRSVAAEGSPKPDRAATRRTTTPKAPGATRRKKSET